jgi:hypothetical protein
MDVVTDEVLDSIRVDFGLARLELLQAQAALRWRDTPATRGHVEQCRERVDAVLDEWNEVVRRSGRGLPARA